MDGRRSSWGFARDDEIVAPLVARRLLGGGPRYEVYEAFDRTLGRAVVAKLLRPDRAADPESLASLEREAELASGLAHPNLVRLLRWSPAPPRPHLVLELVDARSVEQHLERVGAVRVPEVCLLGVHVAAALAYLHSRKVLHLDVKPANVTMGTPPRLLDLSLARVGTAIEPTRRIGTANYMAPEQCLRRTLVPATDVFGLAATLYEAVTAMSAFSLGDPRASAEEERYPQLVEEPLPPHALLPGLPAALDDVIVRGLAKDLAKRTTLADLDAVLRSVLRDLGHAKLLPSPQAL